MSFARGRLHQDAREVTTEELEAWLNSNGWKPRTKKGYLSDVRVLSAWGRKRNLVAENPAAAVELPQEKVLQFARGYDLNICRALAVRYFAGLRSAEVDRLEESEIRESFIEVRRLTARAVVRAKRCSWLMRCGAGVLPRRFPRSWPRWRRWAGPRAWS